MHEMDVSMIDMHLSLRGPRRHQQDAARTVRLGVLEARLHERRAPPLVGRVHGGAAHEQPPHVRPAWNAASKDAPLPNARKMDDPRSSCVNDPWVVRAVTRDWLLQTAWAACAPPPPPSLPPPKRMRASRGASCCVACPTTQRSDEHGAASRRPAIGPSWVPSPSAPPGVLC